MEIIANILALVSMGTMLLTMFKKMSEQAEFYWWLVATLTATTSVTLMFSAGDVTPLDTGNYIMVVGASWYVLSSTYIRWVLKIKEGDWN